MLRMGLFSFPFFPHAAHGAIFFLPLQGCSMYNFLPFTFSLSYRLFEVRRGDLQFHAGVDVFGVRL